MMLTLLVAKKKRYEHTMSVSGKNAIAHRIILLYLLVIYTRQRHHG